jgi:hypothetical protein
MLPKASLGRSLFSMKGDDNEYNSYDSYFKILIALYS